METKKNIVMLPIQKLYHHPHNRKDMGDLSELTESIRLNGVLQNLVVVEYTPWDHPELAVQETDDSYVVVIGNRRLEAAKAAGVAELPCEIAAMTLKDQVKAMAQENLLRKAPTAREQSDNFQLLIDFGESVQEVADSTGFSTTTVRNRLKLNRLPKDKLDEAEERGGTMADYMIVADPMFTDHPDLVDMMMSAIGTKDFANRVSSAKTTVKNRAICARAIEVLKTFATEIQNADDTTMVYQHNYSHWYKKEVEIPADADTVKYFYRIGRDQVDFYREKTKNSIVDQKNEQFQLLQEKAKKAQTELEEASLRAFESRMNFVHNLTPTRTKDHLSDAIAFWGQYCMMKVTQDPHMPHICIPKPDNFELAAFLGIPKESVASSGTSIDLEEWKAATVRTPEYATLAYLYLSLESNQNAYRTTSWTAVPNYTSSVYVTHHKENQTLDLIYEFLGTLGYEMTEEEQQLRNGTHPLFYKAEEYTLETAAEAVANATASDASEATGEEVPF